MAFWTFLIGLVMMGLFSLDWVRRRHFELFYAAHQFVYPLLIMVLWHAASGWFFLLAGLVLHLVDRCILFTNACGDLKVMRVGRNGPYTWLELEPLSAKHHTAAQFAFLNIPAVSLLQWHPFTIASAPGNRTTTFIIKVTDYLVGSGR